MSHPCPVGADMCDFSFGRSVLQMFMHSWITCVTFMHLLQEISDSQVPPATATRRAGNIGARTSGEDKRYELYIGAAAAKMFRVAP